MRLVSVSHLILLGLGVVSCSVASGCSRGSPATPPAGQTAAAHDPDGAPISAADVKMPANYTEAIAHIRRCRDTIRGAVEAGTPAKAHRSLDELDIVLDKLTSLARDSGVPKKRWEVVNTTARQLRDLFNDVHTAIDEQRTPDYRAVAEPINTAIDQLAALAPSATK